MSHFEVSPREREDEARRAYYEFDCVDETYEEYMARLSDRPRAGSQRAESRSTGASQPGTGRSESRDTKEAA